ncbi:MAG: PQQ-like beta-propeller repeat protein [Candidatus Omnitrophica bacterium]|nr:PQQ-like beta-propeller repeat protein [Candidatus Omnitrophota bacterium]
MQRIISVIFIFATVIAPALAKTLTYNEHQTLNLRDQGFPADQRATNALIADGNTVYGVTSGDNCHVFRMDPESMKVKNLATIDGPNTVMKGFVQSGDTLYVATMLSRDQLWLKQRKKDPSFDPWDVNLLPIEESDNTGHLYRVTGIKGESPELEDLGTPVPGQGIHTLAIDPKRNLIYGVTTPMGQFFIYNIESGEAEIVSFGKTVSTVSNHRVGFVTVEKELAQLTPGEAEWNDRLLPKAMYVTQSGTMYTSGWNGRILKYDPEIEEPQQRFSEVAWIPSVPGRQHWNRIDAIVEHHGKLLMGTSDGYIISYDPESGDIKNFGKPIRAIEVMGMAVSPLDGKLYGVNGGDLEGMPRIWSLDLEAGTFEVDIPALQVFNNRRQIGDVLTTTDGTLVIAETNRVANLHLLKPGEPVEWEKSGVLPEENPQEGRVKQVEDDRFAGHKKLEVDVFPIPSSMHGGSGYTAVQIDRDGKVYIGTAYYGLHAELTQLNPKTAQWRSLFESDKLTYQYGRGQGIPGKIHTKLRLGADGKIYGAMKQGYEQHYTIRADIGEAPEGLRGSQFTCHFFSYDPSTDEVEDLGPGWQQEGITSFDVDTERGYLYGCTVPGVFFLVHDLENRRVWNAGAIAHTHPSRYMPKDPGTGRVYHPGETTPEGTCYLTVWDPEEFRLRDVEIVPEEGLKYRHSYSSCCGPAGTNTYYGHCDDQLFVMDTDDSKDGKFHVRPLCYIGVDGDPKHAGVQAFDLGPDGRIYWASSGGRGVPIDIFAWDPKTEEKTYLGACALNGEYINWGHPQGIAFDSEGNMAMHILYAELTKEQQEKMSVSEDFEYKDIEEQPYYLGYPAHDEDTFYSVYYVKGATSIR